MPPAFAEAKLEGLREGELALVSPSTISEKEKDGLERTRWPGRCQVVEDGKVDGGEPSLKWYLDGAHTVESVECCGEWYKQVGQLESVRPSPIRLSTLG